MKLKWPRKDPADVADYQINWAELLGADTITTSLWAATGGLTVNSHTSSSTTTTVWLSGGNAGLQLVTNTITTSGGRTFERSVEIFVGQL